MHVFGRQFPKGKWPKTGRSGSVAAISEPQQSEQSGGLEKRLREGRIPPYWMWEWVTWRVGVWVLRTLLRGLGWWRRRNSGGSSLKVRGLAAKAINSRRPIQGTGIAEAPSNLLGRSERFGTGPAQGKHEDARKVWFHGFISGRVVMLA